MKRMKTLAFAACTLLLAAPLAAQDKAILPGYDYWQTVGGGASYMNFADNPIPAEFFCQGSEAFTGKILLEGAPLATQPVGALGTTDTIVERMDPALFEEGVAFTRIRVKAINLISRDTLITGCGEWNVTMGLTEKQPITEMVYEQLGDDYGHFSADLVLNARITFTHAVNPKLTRTLNRTVHFSEFHQAPFTMRPAANDDEASKQRLDLTENLRVDTDGDGFVDTPLALTALNPDYTATTTTTTATGATLSPRTLYKKCVWGVDAYTASATPTRTTTTTLTTNQTVCVWQYSYNTWICPPGVPAGGPGCVLFGSMHQAPPPGHQHMVIPPCGTGGSGDWCAHGEPNPNWQNPDVVYTDATATTLSQTLQQMWDDGVLVVTPEQLMDEIANKEAAMQK